MKTERTQTVYVCDLCEQEDTYLDPCLRCGKDICDDCKVEGRAINYDDGYVLDKLVWCAECDAILQRDRSDGLHVACAEYKRIGDEMEEAYRLSKQQMEEAWRVAWEQRESIKHEMSRLYQSREPKGKC